MAYLAHPTIDHEISSVDKAAFVTGKEDNGVGLLDSLTETAGGEVDFTTETLGLVITQPVLEEGSAIYALDHIDSEKIHHDLLQRSRTQGIEPESLTSMDNSQLARQRKHCTLTSGISQLRRSTTNQGNHTSSVNDATLGLLVTTQTKNRMFATKPNTLDVDILGKIPDLLGGIDGISIIGVHDTRIIEDHVRTAPAVLEFNHGLDFGFLGHVAFDGFDSGCVRDDFLYLGKGLLESGNGDVCHEHVGAFASK